MMKWGFGSLLCVVCLSVLSACTSVDLRKGSSKTPPTNLNSNESKGFAGAMGLYEQEKYREAAEQFETFIAQTTTSPKYLTAVYHLGLCYELQGLNEKAIEQFRTVSRLAGDQSPQLEAQAVYHLALNHEALGDKTKTIAALADVERRLGFYPSEQADVEIPARLASAYAWLGNENTAYSYFKKAEGGLKRIRAQAEKTGRSPGWLPKTLFNMGQMTLTKMAEPDFESGLKPLVRSQIWLYQAVELNDPVWSKRAADELISLYQEGWNIIESVPLEKGDDEVLLLKEQQQKKVAMASSLRAALDRLETKEHPEGDPSNAYLARVKESVRSIGLRLELLMGSRPVEQDLTGAAKEREGIVRKGKVIDPEGVLEKHKAPKPAVRKKKTKTPTLLNSKDPNL